MVVIVRCCEDEEIGMTLGSFLACRVPRQGSFAVLKSSPMDQ